MKGEKRGKRASTRWAATWARGRQGLAWTCWLVWLVTSGGLGLTGCASAPDQPELIYATRPSSDIEHLLRAEADRWLGTPHRLGGLTRKGIDCSGLVMQIYKHLFDIRLPRTTNIQARMGVSVSRGDLRPGDLVFFQSYRKTRHVGIYLGRGDFVHASSSQGVMISNMQENHWRESFWLARRIL
jgi:cell wall-associated NlpC family hydrolase